MGSVVPVDHAADAIFGLVMMNYWSARDIQMWEYVPLRPFNGKNWVSRGETLEGLQGFESVNWRFQLGGGGAAGEGEGEEGWGDAGPNGSKCNVPKKKLVIAEKAGYGSKNQGGGG